MTTLDAIALRAAAMRTDDTRTTSRLLAFLETRLSLEELVDLREALDLGTAPSLAAYATMTAR